MIKPEKIDNNNNNGNIINYIFYIISLKNKKEELFSISFFLFKYKLLGYLNRDIQNLILLK